MFVITGRWTLECAGHSGDEGLYISPACVIKNDGEAERDQPQMPRCYILT